VQLDVQALVQQKIACVDTKLFLKKEENVILVAEEHLGSKLCANAMKGTPIFRSVVGKLIEDHATDVQGGHGVSVGSPCFSGGKLILLAKFLSIYVFYSFYRYDFYYDFLCR